MRFFAVADTDIGVNKAINQDSLLIKHAIYDNTEILMAVICDGMGGLSKGELASAVVIRAFSDWFTNLLPFEMEDFDIQIVGSKLTLLLKDINTRIRDYGQKNKANMGTTFSGILFVGDEYLILHVGDCRIYKINSHIEQLTVDQTFVAREVIRGYLTPDQAKNDKRRNLLLQCIGASKTIEPQILKRKTDTGIYILCSDGFRHTITESEMLNAFEYGKKSSEKQLRESIRTLINTAKERGEKDNISVIVIKVNADSEGK